MSHSTSFELELLRYYLDEHSYIPLVILVMLCMIIPTICISLICCFGSMFCLSVIFIFIENVQKKRKQKRMK